MRTDKHKALKLRLLGKSYSEIQRVLKVPKSTLSLWLRDVILSPALQDRIATRAHHSSLEAILKHNKQQTHIAERRNKDIRDQARATIKTITKQELMILGIALYWAEGYKRPVMRNGKVRTSHSVRLTNSDPYLVKQYLRFLREVCEVNEEKVTVALRIYEHQNENYLINFWSKVTQIPPSRFYKSYYGVSKSSLDKRPFNTLPYGTVQIVINNTALYHRIMGWIEGLYIND